MTEREEAKEKLEKNTVQFTMRIPIEIKSQLELVAAAQDRSLSKQIISVLRKFVEGQKGGE
ncbi:MAG: Arc family DNA-binding protein [Desulfuromonadaceae bacterium]|nr:Arc family DNA-binding protein [Desulfuromonadaceae bacterium]